MLHCCIRIFNCFFPRLGYGYDGVSGLWGLLLGVLFFGLNRIFKIPVDILKYPHAVPSNEFFLELDCAFKSWGCSLIT